MKSYGTFQVKTEGDIEGRSMVSLGIYTGFIDEIALYLADKCYYSLYFSKVSPEQPIYRPTSDSVHISFEYQLDLTENEVKTILKNRPVEVEVGQFYKSFKISRPLSEREKKEAIKEKALKKLTKEEKEALGLK